jgi:cytochrome c oxidase cbb3-type subunit III
LLSRRLPSSASLLLLLALVASCSQGQDVDMSIQAPPSTAERATLMGTGDFVAGERVPRTRTRNPFEGDVQARSDGGRLYGWFNCAGCHGANGGGGIGPPFADDEWIYGGDPASIFQSIAQGRPNGMPAFGSMVPDEQIWRIELYVRSLAGDRRDAQPAEGRAQDDR